jgi:hypothetical protein
VVVALVLVLLEPDRVEDVELALRPPVRDVGDPRLAEVELGLPGDISRVARVHLAGDRVPHEAVDHQGGMRQERVDVRSLRVRHQEHVGLLDLLESADGRSVEPVAGLEPVLGELVDGDGEVLHQAGKVAEPEVHHLRLGLLRQVQHVLGRRHAASFLERSPAG